MDIAAGIAAVTQGLGIAKALRGIEKSYDEATFKAKIAEVIESLTDAKLALAEAKENMAEREKEIQRLKESFLLREKLVQDRGDYKYIANEYGEPIGYPICPKCEVVDGRIVQLKQDGGLIKGRCPACATAFSPLTAYYSKKEQAARNAERQAEKDEQDRITAKIRNAGRNLA